MDFSIGTSVLTGVKITLLIQLITIIWLLGIWIRFISMKLSFSDISFGTNYNHSIYDFTTIMALIIGY